MKLNHIQSLRGIAALLVCCFHFRERINFSDLKLGNFLFLNGGIGVPIFFIISGFIMVYTSRNYGKNPTAEIKTFLKRRVIRIVPLYYLLTFAWMIMGGTFMIYFTPEVFPRLYSSLLFIPREFPPVLFLGWSLNYEMFFYLVFGLCLIFRNHRYAVFIALFILLITLGKIFTFKNDYLKMATGISNLFFLTGVIFGLVYEKFSISKRNAVLISSIGIAGFWIFYLCFPKNEHILIVSLLFFSFLLMDKINIPANGALVFLGDISYSLYLCHPFSEIFFRRFKTSEILPSIGIFVLEVLVAIFVAKICYEIVEKRFTNYLKLKL